MKFLVTGLPGANPIPVEHGADLLQASLAWDKDKLADGMLDCSYNLFGGGGLAIANASSHEAVMEALLEFPLYPFFDWEVTPLLDFEVSYQQYIDYYKRIAE